uniref:Uncharacterized protein n=1 Tax=Cannabis sativa TaxID=3483 RepID=A0A803NIV4_CANSA
MQDNLLDNFLEMDLEIGKTITVDLFAHTVEYLVILFQNLIEFMVTHQAIIYMEDSLKKFPTSLEINEIDLQQTFLQESTSQKVFIRIKIWLHNTGCIPCEVEEVAEDDAGSNHALSQEREGDAAVEEATADIANDVLAGRRWSRAAGESSGGCSLGEKLAVPTAHQSEPIRSRPLPKGLSARTKNFLKKNIGGRPSASSSLGHPSLIEGRMVQVDPNAPNHPKGAPSSTFTKVTLRPWPPTRLLTLIFKIFTLIRLLPLLAAAIDERYKVACQLKSACKNKKRLECQVGKLKSCIQALNEELRLVSQSFAEYDCAIVDQALYNMWRANPNIDFGFFGPTAV